jgi:hypothetical protein
MNEQAEIFFSDHETKVEENFGHEHFRPEIDRGTLRQILLESLQPETVVWNSHFVSMEKENKGWRLRLKTAHQLMQILLSHPMARILKSVLT